MGPPDGPQQPGYLIRLYPGRVCEGFWLRLKSELVGRLSEAKVWVGLVRVEGLDRPRG